MNLRIIVAVCIFATVLAEKSFAGCQPGNLINNCGFPTNILGWTTTLGTPSHDGTAGSGSSTPGSLQVVATGSTDISFEQCVDVTSLARPLSVGYGIDYRDASNNAIETLTVSVTGFSDTGCTAGNETGNDSNVADGLTSTAYEQVSSTYTVGATTQGVLFKVYALHFNSTITGHFDDAFYGQNVVPVELQSFAVE